MAKKSKRFPDLEKSYKGRYPFKLGTTSFIHPAGYAENAALIGPYVDEIELLFFETLAEDSVTIQKEVQQLNGMSKDRDISFNVHLPTDVNPGHPGRRQRQIAVDALKRVIDLTAPLSPSTWTLHLPFEGSFRDREKVKRWQEDSRKGLVTLLGSGVEPKSLSVETLDYPFEMAAPIVGELDLRICLDIGHCIAHGFYYQTLFKQWGDRIVILHLHGVEGSHDHLSLDKLPQNHAAAILKILKQFKGAVSLEIFSFEKLKASLEFLERNWFKRNV